MRVVGYFCLNCKREVKTFMNIFLGFKLCCKDCRRDRLILLEDMEKGEFEELVKKFKKSEMRV
ncbi:hypothetical protein A3K63_00190 [Candidatus Micrarchaeota archaeon RBG_16_49_10]|nr:MAG: hypothetical protein A3K63_00190 [Candidatus Micrarchaeota archaeon RBG_16_49_10]